MAVSNRFTVLLKLRWPEKLFEIHLKQFLRGQKRMLSLAINQYLITNEKTFKVSCFFLFFYLIKQNHMSAIIKNVTLFLLLGAIAFLGCWKDNAEDNPPAKTKADLLIGKWLITGITTSPARDANGDGTKETDVFAVTKLCNRDFLYIFKPAGVFQLDLGEIKCTTDEGQPEPASWVLSGDQKTVTVTEDGGSSDVFEILQLDDNTLKLRFPNVYSNGAIHQDLLTFRRL